ncbi:tetrapyrrole biosynthesis uroporphyrinogen III synthase [Neolentinus lepideus HHB14362 ss-1]|uniref:Tetrapyrrole biosynthesis uroporphyrinogen III synthase n=1 Tax=Neolentinus lepideus HHB14362 ss-1 TaxID=1314782 RepID=A0A165SEP2_9AGAM|nr:tetrapyrrole biosynthesis uroporphyrinogen III synthase [Neolentinus lepideus HHB14362 ss-1]
MKPGWNVVLLRSPSTDGPDPYETTLRSKGFIPLTVPALETTHVSLDELKRLIREGPDAHNLSGVIITSGRSCEAWKMVVEELVHEQDSKETADRAGSLAASWSSIPFYAVGRTTAMLLLDIMKSYDTPYAPKDVRGGEESGTSEKLSHFILNNLPSNRKDAKLLYLTGDKNRDTLPKILREGGVELQTLQVYGTQGSRTFESDLVRAIESFQQVVSHWWIVYFAPSVADFATPVLRKHFDIPQIDSVEAADGDRTARIASIGPMTTSHLRDELKICVHATAAKPTPDDLAAALNAVESMFES